MVFFCYILCVCHLFGLQPIEHTHKQKDIPSVQYGVIGEKQLNNKLKKHIEYLDTKDNLIGYIKILNGDTIDEASYRYVQHALKKFIKLNVIFVIFHINSFGGDIYPTQKIADLLQKLDINHGIPTLTYVDKYALSAAAMIPYASRFIALRDGAYIGGHYPGKESEVFISSSEKIRSALKDEFHTLAGFYNRNPILAEAMVDPSMIIAYRNNQVVSLDSETQIQVLGESKDFILSNIGSTLTLDTNDLLKFGVADFSVTGADDLLNQTQKYTPFHNSELSKESFLGAIPNAKIYMYDNWKISLYKIITMPYIASLLLILLIVSFYLQLHFKRFGFFGYLGTFCLLVVLTISYMISSFSVLETVILILGVLLFLLEIFVIPGFGTIGIFGIILIILGLFSLMLPGIEKFSVFDFESFSFAANSLLQRLVFLVCSLVISFVLIVVIKRFFSKHFKSLSRLTVKTPQQLGEVDFLEEFEEKQLPKINEIGVTHCTLRPIGKVVVDDRIYDAVAKDDKEIHKHLEVKIVDHKNGKLVVEPVADADQKKS